MQGIHDFFLAWEIWWRLWLDGVERLKNEPFLFPKETEEGYILEPIEPVAATRLTIRWQKDY